MTTETDTHNQTADSVPKTEFKIWRTILLGTGFNNERDFEVALKGAGCTICVDRILGGRNIAEAEREVDLVRCSVAELGFDKPALRRDVISRGEELGLRRCAAEVGPQLRLQYPDQPSNEHLTIAMNDYSNYGETRGVFVISHQGKSLILGGTHGSAIGSLMLLNCQVVFVKPRN